MHDCVNAACSATQTYLGRDMVAQDYDQVVNGTGYCNIILPQRPVNQIYRISWNPVPCIQVNVPNKASCTRATVGLTNGIITLTSWNAGSHTATNLTLSDYATCANLATAISAVSPFAAQSLGQYGLMNAADLRSPQGAFDCYQQIAWFKLRTFTLWDFDFNPQTGEVVQNPWSVRGFQNWRFEYRAGYDPTGISPTDPPMPADLQEAVAELAVATYYARLSNPNLASESLGDYSYTTISNRCIQNLSIGASMALQKYRNIRVPQFVAY